MSVWLDADGDPLPETLKLGPSRVKWLFVLALSLGFVAIAVFLGGAMDLPVRLFSGGFFAICALIAAPQVIGIGSDLRLDAQGFTCRSLFRSWRREWKDCSPFEVVHVGMRGMVGFSTEQDERDKPRLSAVSRGLTGGPSGALPDTYGLSTVELADLMNRFRDRALGASPPLTPR